MEASLISVQVGLSLLVSILCRHSGEAAMNLTRLNRNVPDEQRLYRDLMLGYESSTRPVLNASTPVLVDFELTLQQITDLDERTQVLTTNVFIDQSWQDENLDWLPEDYNNIRTLRIPENAVWLPDTFLFNNADEGSTGFMKGMYVLVNHTGTVLWRVPLKLKSSCKVDIAYFPFDDQKCTWQFGSWIYSAPWIDFRSSIHNIHLKEFMDNSEWELVSLQFERSLRQHPSSMEDHPDLIFTLHIRRRTLYYMFNIIAPCVMLSVLTLLTFWLPNTSGEKISLGLSVFLAFSMFMLLIAEEVPATSESVPLIGIYLTTVMTMTSVSVIMAVMVINLYNRGSKAVHAPAWLQWLVLEGLSRMLCLKHDIDKMTKSIKLDREEEEKYSCIAHPQNAALFGGNIDWNTPSTEATESNQSQNVEPRSCQDCDSKRVLEDIQRQENLYKTIQYRQRQLAEMRSKSLNGIAYKYHDGVENVEDIDADEDDGQANDINFSACDYQEMETVFDGGSSSLTENNSEDNVNSPNGTNQDADISCSIITKQIHTNGKYKALRAKKLQKAKLSIMSISDTNISIRQGVHKKTIPYITVSEMSSVESPSMEEETDCPIWIKRPSVLKREKETEEQKDKSGSGQNNLDRNNKTHPQTRSKKERVEMSKHTGQILDCLALEKHVGNPRQNAIKDQFIKKNPAESKSIKHLNGRKAHTNTLSVKCIKPNIESKQLFSNESITKKSKSSLQHFEVECPKKAALIERRQIVVEWQTIAAVIDRLLFWIFFIGTVVAYVVILFIMPYSKPNLMPDDGPGFQIIRRADILS